MNVEEAAREAGRANREYNTWFKNVDFKIHTTKDVLDSIDLQLAHLNNLLRDLLTLREKL